MSDHGAELARVIRLRAQVDRMVARIAADACAEVVEGRKVVRIADYLRTAPRGVPQRAPFPFICPRHDAHVVARWLACISRSPR